MRLVSLALFAVLLPIVAAAQNRGVYIQAGALADIRFTSSADGIPVELGTLSTAGPTYTWNDLNGDRRWPPGGESSSVVSSLLIGFPYGDFKRSRSRVTPGASAALGVFITPSVSLRVEGSFQGTHVEESGSGDVNPLVTIENRQASTVTDIYVAAGWHQGGARRTTITYLAGMVFRRQREETTLAYSYSLSFRPLPPIIGPGQTVPSPVSFEEQFGSTSYGAGIIAGLDVAFKLSDHVAVVPQIRLVAANSALSLRPAVAMRWQP